MSSSQTGNCPGCRFSFPSMFWLWAGLRQRASSGKMDVTEPITCLDLSSVREVESRKLEGDLMYCMLCVCVRFIECIVSINKCVWSPVSLYFNVGSPCVQYTHQTAEQTQPSFAPESSTV